MFIFLKISIYKLKSLLLVILRAVIMRAVNQRNLWLQKKILVYIKSYFKINYLLW